MNAQDKKEIRQIFNEGLEQLVLPILDDIYEKMATKEDIESCFHIKSFNLFTNLSKTSFFFSEDSENNFFSINDEDIVKI